MAKSLTYTNELYAGGAGIASADGNLANTRAGTGSSVGVGNFENVAEGGPRYSSANPPFSLTRTFLHFDTTNIPVNSKIVSAFIRLPGTNTSNNNATPDSIVIVKSLVSSNTVLATGDIQNYGATAFSTFPMASYNSAGNNDLELNASGLANIVPGGHSKFAMLTLNDLNNYTIVGSQKNNQTYSNTGMILSVVFEPPFQGAMI